MSSCHPSKKNSNFFFFIILFAFVVDSQIKSISTQLFLLQLLHVIIIVAPSFLFNLVVGEAMSNRNSLIFSEKTIRQS